MQQSKYRGKTKEGKWVYGWYCRVKEHKYWSGEDKQSVAPERHFIIQDDSEYSLDRIEPYYVYDVSEAVEVIPETVGQFVTKDKNNDDVFVDDKVDYVGHKAIIKQNDGDFGYHLEFVDLPSMESQKTGKKVTNILYREMCNEIELLEEEK